MTDSFEIRIRNGVRPDYAVIFNYATDYGHYMPTFRSINQLKSASQMMNIMIYFSVEVIKKCKRC